MDWEETFSLPVSYSGSQADVNQTLSLEKQKSKHFFLFIYFFVTFHCEIFHWAPAPPIIIIQFVIFFAAVSSFTISQGALNVGGKNMSKNSAPRLSIPISILCVLKTCLRSVCRTGTQLSCDYLYEAFPACIFMDLFKQYVWVVRTRHYALLRWWIPSVFLQEWMILGCSVVWHTEPIFSGVSQVIQGKSKNSKVVFYWKSPGRLGGTLPKSFGFILCICLVKSPLNVCMWGGVASIALQ